MRGRCSPSCRPRPGGTPAALPAPRSYGDIVGARLAAAPPAARELAGAVAVLGRGAALSEAAALAGIAAPLDAVDALIATELVRSDGRSIAFVHPLAAVAVYERVPPARRARLHLAAAADAEGRGDVDAALLHRRRAATGPDEELADALATRSAEQEARGLWLTAAGTAATAARLTADDDRRATRLLAATDLFAIAGDVRRARVTADALPPDAGGLLHDAVLGQLLTYELRPAEAQTLLDRAWQRCDAEADPEMAGRIARATVQYHLVRLRARAALPWADRVLRFSPEAHPGRAFGHWFRALALTALGEAPARRQSSPARSPAPRTARRCRCGSAADGSGSRATTSRARAPT